MPRTRRMLATLALSLGLVTATSAAAIAAPTSSAIEDQNDRLLRTFQAEVGRSPAEVARAQAMARNLTPAPAGGLSAAQPAPRTAPAVPGRDVAVLPTLLVGLIGGLIGGAAAMAGWTAASRRRPHGAASAT
jgi:hypothetical protein